MHVPREMRRHCGKVENSLQFTLSTALHVTKSAKVFDVAALDVMPSPLAPAPYSHPRIITLCELTVMLPPRSSANPSDGGGASGFWFDSM